MQQLPEMPEYTLAVPPTPLGPPMPGVAGPAVMEERGRNALTIAAATLLFVAAVVHVVGLFSARVSSATDPLAYDWPASLGEWIWYGVWFPVLGELVLSRRRRELGLGLTVALAVAWPANELVSFLPSYFEPHGKPGNVLPYDATLLLLMAAGVVAGIELWRGRRRNVGALPPALGMRLLCVIGGTAAAVAWFVGDWLDWSTDRISYVTVTGAPVSRSTTCCHFTQLGAWGKAEVIDSLVVLVLFAVLAAFARSPKVSAGFLVGGVLFLGGQPVTTIVRALIPGPSMYGANRAAQLALGLRDLDVSSTPLAGFWIASGGLVLLLVLAVLRLRSRSRGHNVSSARRTSDAVRLVEP
ncbi:MAG TPA: hypothetical protein VFN97_08005 [Actinospica sp.]|nr:hypothetical protein [Actinospica sp.]